jgi:hypothetical protein
MLTAPTPNTLGRVSGGTGVTNGAPLGGWAEMTRTSAAPDSSVRRDHDPGRGRPRGGQAMPSHSTDTTGDDVPRLAAIEVRYELAKARIAGVAVPAGSGGRVHDTVAIDVQNTKPPLIPAHRRTAVAPVRGSHPTKHRTPATEAARRGRRLWRSLRMPWLVGRGLPVS